MKTINLQIIREVTNDKVYQNLKRCYLEIVNISEGHHLHIHSPISLFPSLLEDYKHLRTVSKLYNCIDLHVFHILETFENRKETLGFGTREHLELCYLLDYK